MARFPSGSSSAPGKAPRLARPGPVSREMLEPIFQNNRA
jgi:hypothetical protein